MPSGARATVKRKVSSLSSFWRWLIARGLADSNPWRDQQLGKKKAGQRKGFDDDVLIKLLTGTYTDRYQVALFDLFRLALATGARSNELCSLQPQCMTRHSDGWWMTIEHGKTEAAQRIVPVHSCVDHIVKRRVAEGGKYLIDELEPGGPDRKRNWYFCKAFARYRKRVGVGARFSDFHALRKTFVAALEGADVQEPTVKLLIGHARNSMTFGVYSKGERVRLRETIDKLTYGDEVMRLLSAPLPDAHSLSPALVSHKHRRRDERKVLNRA